MLFLITIIILGSITFFLALLWIIMWFLQYRYQKKEIKNKNQKGTINE